MTWLVESAWIRPLPPLLLRWDPACLIIPASWAELEHPYPTRALLNTRSLREKSPEGIGLVCGLDILAYLCQIHVFRIEIAPFHQVHIALETLPRFQLPLLSGLTFETHQASGPPRNISGSPCERHNLANECVDLPIRFAGR